MEHRLDHINIIAWQSRRESHRPNLLTMLLLATISVSASLLLLRFAFRAPLPLEVLQVAFALLAATGALLLMRVLVSLILRFQRP